MCKRTYNEPRRYVLSYDLGFRGNIEDIPGVAEKFETAYQRLMQVRVRQRPTVKPKSRRRI